MEDIELYSGENLLEEEEEKFGGFGDETDDDEIIEDLYEDIDNF